MKVFKKINKALRLYYEYRKVYKNYISVLLNAFLKNKESKRRNLTIKAKFRDGKVLQLPYGLIMVYANAKKSQNTRNIENVKIEKNILYFQFYDKQLQFDMPPTSDPYATFFYEDYKFLRVNGKVVIDIGMNIGDSTIYFSIKGAKRVIGLEPFPYTFRYAEKNICLNNILNCTLLNAGYGEDKEITVDQEIISTSGSSLVQTSKGKQIKLYSLSTLMKKYEIDSAIVKMDCEGCEYWLLNEPENVFNCIEMIQIEYHYGYKRLVDKLKSVGFNVEFTEPEFNYDIDAENPSQSIGYIFAEKQKIHNTSEF